MGMYQSMCEVCGNGFMWHSSTPGSNVCYDCRKPKEHMEKVLEAVKKFHEAFGHPVADEPTLVDLETINLRFKLMEEENREYLDACYNRDLVEVADALGDQLYILAGTMLVHGMQNKIMEVFEEIQRSNMSKLGEDGKPIYRVDGKVQKGPNYSPPDIKTILDGTTTDQESW